MTALKNPRNMVGYMIGFAVFLILLPIVMWKVSDGGTRSTLQIAILILLACAGLGLSVWSIVYMRLVGEGNPMDVFNHELAPRTKKLMTDGPYKICRNPMLLGVLLYYVGILIFLRSFKALLVFLAFAAVMAFQVRREEARLEHDFGQVYREYKRNTKRIIPFIW